MKKHTLSRWMAAAILVCALAGVGIKMGIFLGRVNLHQLRYFTTLSNLLAAGCAGCALLRGRDRGAGIKGLAVLCILVTAAVYHGLLAGTFGGFSPFSLDWWGDKLVHTAVPLLTVLDYLLFDQKGTMRWYFPLLWILAPLGYFAATAAIARTGLRFPGSYTAYPYPFLDVWTLGWGPVLRNILLLAVGFLLLGALITGLDARLAKRKARA